MSRNVHTPKQRFALQMLVQAEFKTANINDIKFADYAGNKLGYSVSASQVAGAREVLDIPSLNSQKVHVNDDRFGEIEQRLAILEQRVEVYLKGSR